MGVLWRSNSIYKWALNGFINFISLTIIFKINILSKGYTGWNLKIVAIFKIPILPNYNAYKIYKDYLGIVSKRATKNDFNTNS